MKILIAEDDRTSRLMLEEMLKNWGYDVVSTASGEEAWEIMQGDNPPPLCVVDWMMPEMNGMEFCRKIRESSAVSLAYIILLTSKRQRDDVIAGLEAGANDYVRKPFEREQLQARIEVANKIVQLQDDLIKKVIELKSLSRGKNLYGFMQQLQAYVFGPGKVETVEVGADDQKKPEKGKAKAAEK